MGSRTGPDAVSRRHQGALSVTPTPDQERLYCDVYNAGRAAKAARKAMYSPSPERAPAPAGNVKAHHLEAQGGGKSYKEGMLAFAKRSGCDTIITLSCHRDASHEYLRSLLEPIVHKAQSKYYKRRQQYVDIAFYVEKVPGNLHVHGLISFPSDELRERFLRLFPLTDEKSKQERRNHNSQPNESGRNTENKCGYWTNLCNSGTYDLQFANDKDAAISYAQKAQNRNADFQTVFYSVDFVTSTPKRKPKARYKKIVK